MGEAEIAEYDQGGALLATYVTTDRVLSIKQVVTTKSPWEQLLDVFLPEGYPTSVSEDYLGYQTYDSLQAFASSIAGMLSSRAVLEGIGVGDSKSHPTTALILSVFQESFGRIATILFAHRLGSALEPECKMYRFLADILNDMALIVDCLSPAFPKPTRVVLFSTSSMLRALCGVAAGSAKASLSAHFAKGGNLGDVNAKDSSQETVISLLGMLAGGFVVSWVESPTATWFSLICLLIMHLTLNYLAVRSVKMRKLNRQRANLVFSHLLAHDKALTLQQVSEYEKLFEKDGALRWSDGELLGFARIGISLKSIVASHQSWQIRNANIPSVGHRNGLPDLADILPLFQKEEYVLIFKQKNGQCKASILLKRNCEPSSHLKAWFHALVLAKDLSEATEEKKLQGKERQFLESSLIKVNKRFDEYMKRLKSVGWELNDAALETQCGPRISF